MHVADGEQYLTDIEHGYIIAEPSIFTKSVKKLTSRTKLKDHVDEGHILEGSFEGVNEGVIEFTEYFLLEFDVLDLFEIDDMWFGYLFQSEHFFVGADYLLYTSEGACS